jgi:hypothetical protein
MQLCFSFSGEKKVLGQFSRHHSDLRGRRRTGGESDEGTRWQGRW